MEIMEKVSSYLRTNMDVDAVQPGSFSKPVNDLSSHVVC